MLKKQVRDIGIMTGSQFPNNVIISFKSIIPDVKSSINLSLNNNFPTRKQFSRHIMRIKLTKKDKTVSLLKSYGYKRSLNRNTSDNRLILKRDSINSENMNSNIVRKYCRLIRKNSLIKQVNLKSNQLLNKRKSIDDLPIPNNLGYNAQ